MFAAGACVAIGDLTLIASVTDFAIYLVFIAVNVVIIALRFRTPDHARPFRSPRSIGKVPVLPVLGLLAVFVMLPSLRFDAVVLGLGIGLAGVVVDWTWQRQRKANLVSSLRNPLSEK